MTLDQLTADNFQPLADRVIIRKDDYEQERDIYRDDGTSVQLVTTHKPDAKRRFTGTVIAHGPGPVSQKGILIPSQLRTGMRVLWQKARGAGSSFELDAHDVKGYCVCHEGDIIAEIEDEPSDKRIGAVMAILGDLCDADTMQAVEDMIRKAAA